MAVNRRIPLVAAALAAATATPLHAQDKNSSQDLSQMRAELEALTKRINELEAELDQARAEESQTDVSDVETKDETSVEWKGAPELSGPGGFTFKPRGRIQIDAGSISSPAGFDDPGTGFGSEVRRAYLGVEGELPGNFGYRAEVDLAGGDVEITDLYITYSPSDPMTITLGHQKPFWGLEEMTSDLFTSFTERAAFNSAFGFERRLGASIAWNAGALLAQGGVFTDSIPDLGDDANNALSFDGRIVFMPKIGDNQLHLGGSTHHFALNDSGLSVRYRARPFIHTTDIRFTDTGSIPATSETSFGVEGAYIAGPLHLAGEGHWRKLHASGVPDASFFGGYVEAGYFLTGESRGYKAGNFDRTKPSNPLGGGGIGAVQINLRYDHLDLKDGEILGGLQDTYGLSLVWTPTAYTRFIANYGHVVHTDAAISAAGDRDYSVDAFALRAQVDF